MVWYLACYEGSRFAAYAPIAGSFWDPMPTNCPSGPVNMRHIHGLTDHTMPLAGRSLRGGLYRQSNVREGFEMWKTIDACPAQPTHQETLRVVTCDIYDDCASGKELQFCLHPGEHEVWTQWLRDDYAAVDALAKKQARATKSATAAVSPSHSTTVAR